MAALPPDRIGFAALQGTSLQGHFGLTAAVAGRSIQDRSGCGSMAGLFRHPLATHRARSATRMACVCLQMPASMPLSGYFVQMAQMPSEGHAFTCAPVAASGCHTGIVCLVRQRFLRLGRCICVETGDRTRAGVSVRENTGVSARGGH